MAELKYIKIAKIDSNGIDLSTTLTSLAQIILPLSTGNKIYVILTSTEFPDYFLFGVKAPDTDDIPAPDHTKIEEYVFSGSMDTTQYVASSNQSQTLIPIGTVIEDNLNFIGSGSWDNSGYGTNFQPVNNLYFINTITQKDITVKLQGTLTTTASPTLPLSIQVRLYNNDGTTIATGLIAEFSTADTATGAINISGTIPAAEALPGSFIAVKLSGANGNVGPRFAQFSSDARLLISSATTSTQPTELILEPYLSQYFPNSDCDVLQGEVEGERPNPFLQDVDYSTSQTIPVNVISLISGSATRATVPESFYTQLTSITPRYLGAKNQSEKINVWTSSSFNIGNYGNTSPIEIDSINIFEFAWGGGTSPEILGWGGMKMSNILQVNTTSSVRVINKSSGVQEKLYDDYRLQSTSLPVMQSYRRSTDPLDPVPSIRAIDIGAGSSAIRYVWQVSQSRGEFYTTLNNVVPINTKIQIGSYGINQADNPIIPPSTKIAALGFAAPGKSSYIFTSSYDDGIVTGDNPTASNPLVKYISGSYGVVKSNQPGLMIFNWNNDISKVKKNQDGYYQAGTTTKLTTTKVINDVNAGLTRGERWFLTIFRELNSAGSTGTLEDALTLGENLIPFNYGYDEKDENGNYPYPLANRGVYELTGTDPSFSSVYDMNPVFFTITPPIKFGIESGSSGQVINQINIGDSVSTENNQYPDSPTNGLGMLMWKAVGKDQLTGEDYVLIQDNIGGVGQGYFTTEFITEEIQNNIEKITKEFGSNKT